VSNIPSWVKKSPQYKKIRILNKLAQKAAS
jgi:hypothetical protein